MAFRARIDHDGVYWGPEEVAELGPDDVAAPDEAIHPGAYRWQPAVFAGEGAARREVDCGHWAPLEPKHVRKERIEITAERALYEQIRQLHMSNPLLVAGMALDWARQYETTWDADLGLSLSYFRDLKAKGA